MIANRANGNTRLSTVLVALLLAGLASAHALAATKWPEPGVNANRKIDYSKVTYYVSATGSDASDGRSRSSAFATLQHAADVVQPGQTVLLTTGVYRQGFHIAKEGRPDAWITFEAEPGAVIEGADIRKDWKAEAATPGVYSIDRPSIMGGAYQQPDTPLINRPEQVMVDGKLLRQVTDQAMLKPRNVFWVDDAAKKLYVCLAGGANPNDRETMVTTLSWAVAIGGPGNTNWWRDESIGLNNKAAFIRLEGFAVRHIANFSRMGAIQVRGICHDIDIENCDVQWANVYGIEVESMHIYAPAASKWIDHETHHVVIRNCRSSNNGWGGIGCGQVADLLIENNLVENNNYKGQSPWAEGGGIKTGFFVPRITYRNNVLINNINEGLWFDNATTDCVIENNFIYGSVATGILNECTPCRPVVRVADKETTPLPTPAQVHALRMTGTTIRNNIVIGTRVPGGDGISISSSPLTTITNNILYANDGNGINMGSSQRGDSYGYWGNRVEHNILDRNFKHVSITTDKFDPSGRSFDNVVQDNLYLRARSTTPFRIDGVETSVAQWQAANPGDTSVFQDTPVFKDPEHFDFTVVDAAAAKRIGFDHGSMRLDWKEFLPPPAPREDHFAARDYTPIDLANLYNRSLVDDVPGDGKGGWTDQGPNDMRNFPTGRQTLDGVTYQLGTVDRGAILLDNPQVKPGGFPSSVEIPVGKTFAELDFAYAAAWTPESGEVARFVVHYDDGSSVAAPVVAGKQILDWWYDPGWQAYANLNDNGVYVAWQGPNKSVARVTAYYYRWANPNPEKKIVSVTFTNADAPKKIPFFLLGVTGANSKPGAKTAKVFGVTFDGDVDATGSDGGVIEARGYNVNAFDAGKFVSDTGGKGFIPMKPVYYATPADFPIGGKGMISLWLKADDWATADRVAQNQRLDYARTMTPFSTSGATPRWAPWQISFEVDKATLKQLTLDILLGGEDEKFDATNLIKPDQWFLLTVSWQPRSDGRKGTLRRTYLDGHRLSEKLFDDIPDVVANNIYVGVPKNGGQPWRGAMRQLVVLNIPLSE